MRTQFQLVLATIFLTAVIWIYADLTSHKIHDTDIAVRLEVPTDISLRLDNPTPDDPNVTLIPVTLRGSKATIDKRKLQRSAGADPFELVINVDSDSKSGVQQRNIVHELTNLPAIRDMGLHVDEVHQRTIEFKVERYKKVKLQVYVYPGKYSISPNPKIEPEKVTARILESDYERLNGSLERVSVTLDEEYRQDRSDEQIAIFDIPLSSPWFGVNAKFTPGSVKVKVGLTQEFVKESFKLIPLNVMATPKNLEDYEFRCKVDSDEKQSITIDVPISKSGKLTNDKIHAYVRIEEIDISDVKDKLERKKKVWFRFPSEFKDVVINTEKEVTIIIVKKSADEKSLPAASLP
ncbi:MAG: YbbR-like domain-containing protein [Planctomycetota bacterium]|jgi:hypothetical protein